MIFIPSFGILAIKLESPESFLVFPNKERL